MTEGITWAQRVANLTKAMGRKPTLSELRDAAQVHQMTPAEIEQQRMSWVRGMTARCQHGVLDFEQCPDCRARKRCARHRLSLSNQRVSTQKEDPAKSVAPPKKAAF